MLSSSRDAEHQCCLTKTVINPRAVDNGFTKFTIGPATKGVWEIPPQQLHVTHYEQKQDKTMKRETGQAADTLTCKSLIQPRAFRLLELRHQESWDTEHGLVTWCATTWRSMGHSTRQLRNFILDYGGQELLEVWKETRERKTSYTLWTSHVPFFRLLWNVHGSMLLRTSHPFPKHPGRRRMCPMLDHTLLQTRNA